MQVEIRRLAAYRPNQRTRTIATFSALTVTLATLAIFHDGTKVQDLHLNDGGVWVTNHNLFDSAYAAHLNYPSLQLDSYTSPAGAGDFDITQEANNVVVEDPGGHGSIAAIDTATWRPGDSAGLPAGATASQGTSIEAIADPIKGAVWAIPAGEASAFQASSAKPVLTGVPGVRAVVGKDDVIHTVAPDGKLRDLTRDGDAWHTDDLGDVPTIADNADVVLTTIGGTGVVFNRDAGWIGWDGHHTEIGDAKNALLQQSGSDADYVALATPTALLEVPLGGGTVTTVEAGSAGSAARPVTVGACTYAAWSGSGAHITDCAGSDPDAGSSQQLADEPASGGDLVFRTNRDIVVLNNAANGDVFTVMNKFSKLDDPWRTIRLQIEQSKKNTKNDKIAFHRTKDNHAPTAKPDDFGVRPGTSVTLPVLGNDTDPDGDVLVADLKTAHTPIGDIEPVRDGRAVRISVTAKPDTATARFSYTANDGRTDGTATATVTLHVRPEATNGGARPITPLRPSAMTVRSGGSGEHHILQEWIDNDGDPLWVRNVAFPDGLRGTYRPDGDIRIEDDGRKPARVEHVKVTLTDGRGANTVADLAVTVAPRSAALKPVVNADFVSVRAGEDVTIHPLANDTDPTGQQLFLSLKGATPAGVGADQTEDQGLVITGRKPGTTYLEYTATDGNGRADSVVRVDVLPASGTSLKPVPDDDLAVVPPDGYLDVPVLDNDTDPQGGVLVLSGATARDSSVRVEIIGHEFLRVYDAGLAPGHAGKIDYTVANAAGGATGTVTAVLDSSGSDAPPTAVDDTAVVRAGDVVTVDVRTNDVSPSSRPLAVLHKVTVPQGSDLGTAWVSENKVRFKAGDRAGDVRVAYEIADPDGNTDTGIVQIAVQPAGGADSPPLPEALTARTFLGGEASIKIPLDGIDPDGDSVTLVGLDTTAAGEGPQLGAVRLEGDTLDYQANAIHAGTDSFGYVVEDAFGQRATGQVRVGVVDPPPTNQPPVTTADRVEAKPGRALAVDVTTNDTDPEGEQVSLSGVDRESSTSTGATVGDDGRVHLTTPSQDGSLHYSYTVQDPLDASSQNSLTVTVDKNHTNIAPIARDDRVPLAEVVGHTSVTVDVLKNDEDPDGDTASVDFKNLYGASVTDKRELRIPVKPERQVIVYTIVDDDDDTGTAVIDVPGSDSEAAQAPVLRDDATLPIHVLAGTSKKIDLASYVAVRTGRTPVLAFSENLGTGPGGSAKPAKDSITFAAEPDFYGWTNVTATIADGQDAAAKHSVITFPIFVDAGGHTPPRLRVPAIEIAPKEPWTGDLDRIGFDPDKGARLSYQVSHADPHLHVDVKGHELIVETADGAKPRDQLAFTLEATDDTGLHAQPQRVTVQVLSSTRREIELHSASLDVDAGKKTDIDVDKYVDFNPYGDDGKPVTIVGVPSVSGGHATVSDPSGTKFSVTPDEAFRGRLTVAYTLADASGQPDRRVTGQLVLNVAGKPQPPSAPTATATVSQTVQVDWHAGSNNGAPITGYTVTWRGGSNGSKTLTGTATTFTATNLVNGKDYYFQVVATNRVGDSVPSPWSAKATPDELPQTPTNVRVAFGDEKLYVTWDQPECPGGCSAIKDYRVRVNGASRSLGTKQTHATLDGLTNGTQYKVQLLAINGARAPGADGIEGASNHWSTVVAQKANGLPEVGAVTLTADPQKDDPSAVLSWTPVENGYGIHDQEVRNHATKALVACVRVTATSCRVHVSAGHRTAFDVRIFNRDQKDPAISGWSGWTPSNQVTFAAPPGGVPNVNAVPTGNSGDARVTFGKAATGGNDAITYRYRAGGSGPDYPISSGDVIHGLADGSPTNIAVWAVGTSNGNDVTGPANTDAVSAFGACTASVTNPRSGYQSVTFDWSVVSNGRDCAWTGSNGGQPSGSGAGGGNTEKVSGNDNSIVTLTVHVATKTSGDDPSVSSPDGSANGRTWSPSIDWMDAGPAPDNTGNCNSSCRYFGGRLSQWQPGGHGYCPILHEGTFRNNQTWWYRTGDAGSDGNWSGRLIGSPNHPLAWSTTVYGNAVPGGGNCQASPPAGANVGS